jgi:hypothetical protein
MSLLVLLMDFVLIGAGYWLGRYRPIHRARGWARSSLAFGPMSRASAVCVIALMPATFARLLWHRVRHGAYPQPPPRRPAPVPVTVTRRARRDTSQPT